MEQLISFLHQLGSNFTLDEKLIIRKKDKFFLLNENLTIFMKQNFLYAGNYLGKSKYGKFLPSFTFLKMLATREAKKVIINKKSEWLFICGRDIFKQGIIRMIGAFSKGDYTLILNVSGDCIGLGKLIGDPQTEKPGVLIKNISDVGDFLRRER